MYLSSFSVEFTNYFIPFCTTFSLFCTLRHFGSICIHIGCFGVFSGSERGYKEMTRHSTLSDQEGISGAIHSTIHSIKAYIEEAVDNHSTLYSILYSTKYSIKGNRF